MLHEISDLLPNDYQNEKLNSHLKLVKFSGSEIKSIDFYDNLSLNPSQKVVLSSLLLLSVDNHAMTLKKISTHLESQKISFGTQSTLRRIFQEFRKLQILREEDVYHNGVLLPRCKVMVFCDEFETSAADINRKALKAGGATTNQKRKKDMLSQSEALERRNLSETDKSVDSKFLPDGVMYSRGLFPDEIRRMSPIKATGTKKIGHNFPTNGGEFHIEARSIDQVSTQGALATGLVIMMIAIAHNNKMLTQGRFKKAFEEKEVPCYIGDIVRLRGMKDGGTSRKMIRDHINWLRETIYKVTDLEGVSGFDDLKKTFRTDDFQFFSQVSSNADEAPRIVGTSAEVKANLFFIKLHDSIIAELSREDKRHFFSLPWKMLTAEPLVLALYIGLRSARVENEVMDLEDLKNSMHFDGKVELFEAQLESDLLKADFNLHAKGADFNLCGYYITKSINLDGKPQFRITCDTKEMISMSGAKYNEGKANAPTIQNPLLSKTVTELKFATRSGHFQKTFVSPSTQRSTQLKEVLLDGGKVTVTFYDDDDRCLEVADAIKKQVGGGESQAAALVDSLRAQLQPIGYQDSVISPKLFREFADYLSDRLGYEITNAAIVQRARNYRKKKILAWYDRDFNSLFEDFI